jgi:hypothetical protein
MENSSSTKEKFLYRSLLSMIIVISFYHLSAFTSYIYHSDIAVQALMTYDLKLPGDLYYWGQDRLGSGVPLLGHFIYKCFHFTPLVSASISEYIFLTIGFLAFSTLFKTSATKIIFAIVWFLPSIAFQELIQLSQPYGEQACFLGIMVFCMNRSVQKERPAVTSLLFFFGGSLALFVSVWISDLSWIAWFLIVCTGVVLYLQQNNNGKILPLRLQKIPRKWLLFAGVFVLSSLIGIAFVMYAKANAVKDNLYSKQPFGTLSEDLAIIKSKGQGVLNTLLFNTNNVLLSLHALWLLIGIAALIYVLTKEKQKEKPSAIWRNYFIWYTILCAGVLFSSHWVYFNYMANRYFTVLYVSVWLVLLLTLDRYTGKKAVYLRAFFLLSALFSAASSVVPYYSEQKPFEAERMNEFKALGKIGVIGNYWRSYDIAAADPENIKATPHDTDMIRCRTCIDSVFSCPTIYLVQDGWLDSLPKETWQFGRNLIRIGETDTIGGFIVAPYTIRKDQKN